MFAFALGMPDETVISCSKTAESIKIPFGLRAWVGSKNHVLDGVQVPQCEGAIFMGEGMPTHAR